MNKKYIIGAVVVLIALWVGLSWGNKSAVAPETPAQEEEQMVTATTPVKSVVPAIKPVSTAVSTPAAVQSVPAITKDGSVIVYYTNTGFSPKTVTIKAGKSVHFVNSSSKAMSVTTTTTANQAQSELNQGKTVGNGGTYDFTFMTAGSWVYMNRNAQSDFGTVVVE